MTTALALIYFAGLTLVFLASNATKLGSIATKVEHPLMIVGARLGLSISWPLFAAALCLFMASVCCALAVFAPFALVSLIGQRRRDKVRWDAEFAAAVRSREFTGEPCAPTVRDRKDDQ